MGFVDNGLPLILDEWPARMTALDYVAEAISPEQLGDFYAELALRMVMNKGSAEGSQRRRWAAAYGQVSPVNLGSASSSG